MKKLVDKEYFAFLNEIKSRIVTARIQAIRSVNNVKLAQLVPDLP